MKGTIRYRSGAWRLQVYAGRDLAGKRRQIARTVRAPNNRAGRKIADAEMAKLLVEVDAQRIRPTDSMTVAELIARWIEHGELDWSPKTTLERRRMARLHITPHIGDRPVDRLQPMEIDQLYNLLRRKGLAAGSVQQAHQLLRAAFAQAIRWGLVSVNPARSEAVRAPRKKGGQPPAPDAEAVATAVAEAERDPMWCAYLWLAATTGARRGELVGLRWSDVDLEAGVLTLDHAMTVGASGVVEKEVKQDRVRRLSLDEVTVGKVDRWRKVQREGAMAVGCRPGPYLFSPDGLGDRPARPEAMTRRWIRVRRRCGLPEELRLHDLRHHMATQLLGAGVDVRTVAERLGHGQTSTTLDIYAHALPPADQEAAVIMARIVGGG